MKLLQKFLFRSVIIALLIIAGIQPVAANANSAGETAFWNAIATTTADNIETAPVDEDISASSPRPLIAEPSIRVGLYKTANAVTFTSDFGYEVFSGAQSLGTLAPNDAVTVSYQSGLYHFNSQSFNFDSPHYFRLVPSDTTSTFTLTNYQRPVRGRGKTNFNRYRGIFEYRYSPKSKLPYIINELPLESYVAGIAESDDGVPTAYAKALLTAARSYAFAMLGATPSEKYLFDVFATTQDQLYLGYNSEITMPRVAQAAQDTAGEMVTHQGKSIITPYFGHSNGQTKSWPGKTRPWLKSVTAVYDKGKRLWGHGYGMSCNDASRHALKDGWTYQDILKYYYTGTEVEKIY